MKRKVVIRRRPIEVQARPAPPRASRGHPRRPTQISQGSQVSQGRGTGGATGHPAKSGPRIDRAASAVSSFRNVTRTGHSSAPDRPSPPAAGFRPPRSFRPRARTACARPAGSAWRRDRANAADRPLNFRPTAAGERTRQGPAARPGGGSGLRPAGRGPGRRGQSHAGAAGTPRERFEEHARSWYSNVAAKTRPAVPSEIDNQWIRSPFFRAGAQDASQGLQPDRPELMEMAAWSTNNPADPTPHTASVIVGSSQVHRQRRVALPPQTGDRIGAARRSDDRSRPRS